VRRRLDTGQRRFRQRTLRTPRARRCGLGRWYAAPAERPAPSAARALLRSGVWSLGWVAGPEFGVCGRQATSATSVAQGSQAGTRTTRPRHRVFPIFRLTALAHTRKA
jgi:hypothetical protein